MPIKRAYNFVLASKQQLFRYVVVGLSGVVIDIGTLSLLTKLYGINPTMAIVYNQILLITYNFILNKYWSFSNRELPHKQFVRYMTLVLANYAFSIGVMYLLNEIYNIEEILVRIGTIAVMTMWNFLLYKKWVYK